MPETTVAGGVTMAVAVGATLGTVGVAAWDMNGLEMVR